MAMICTHDILLLHVTHHGAVHQPTWHGPVLFVQLKRLIKTFFA